MKIAIRRLLAFSFLENYLVMLLGLISSMILARLLTPKEIGIFSVGAVLVGIGHLLRDFGVGQFLIQAPEVGKSRIRAAMAVQLITSTAIALILLIVCRPIAQFYEREELRQVVSLLALNFLLIPFASIVMTWFRRQLQYRASFIVAISATLAGVVATIVLAFLGFGYMSMVWGSIANTLATVVAANLMRPSWFPWTPSLKGMRELFSFGGYASAAGVVQEAGNASPDLVIGKALGVSDVAIFGKALSVVAMFSMLVMRAVWPVSVPVFARQRHGGGDLVQTYCKSLRYLTALAWPFFAFIAVTAFPLVRVLFGDQWDASVPLVRILALQAAIAICYSLVSPILMAHGRVKEQFYMSAGSAVVAVALLLVSVSRGLEAVAAAACVAACFTLIYSTWMLKRVLSIKTTQLLRSAGSGLVIALVVAASTAAALAVHGQGWRAPGWALAPAAAIALLSWYLVVRLVRHPLAEETTNLLRRLYLIVLRGA
jgi:O-antigen/teichoic acid export membrane protein